MLLMQDGFADAQDVNSIKANKLLQILRRWKSQSSKQASVATTQHRSTSSRAFSCSRLPLVPLRCVSFHLHSDDDDEDEDEDGAREDDHKWSSFATNRTCKSSRIHSPRTPTHRGAPARALSCPKLSSPLSSCTPFSSLHGVGDEQREEELECLNPCNDQLEEGLPTGSSSSKASSPLKLQSKGPATPKGYLALYVGEERKRFLVKANLVNHPLFGVLLEKAREEFGFEQKGPLNIPCEIAFFQHIMLLMQSNDPLHTNADYYTNILLPSQYSATNILAATVV